jgi:hypothetical protein
MGAAVIIARYVNILVVMTLPAFQELTRVTAAVSEVHLEEQYLREGLELVIWGNLHAVGPAQPSRQLTRDQILLIRKSFCSYARVSDCREKQL